MSVGKGSGEIDHSHCGYYGSDATSTTKPTFKLKWNFLCGCVREDGASKFESGSFHEPSLHVAQRVGIMWELLATRLANSKATGMPLVVPCPHKWREALPVH